MKVKMKHHVGWLTKTLKALDKFEKQSRAAMKRDKRKVK
jgi:hypothetical protein